MHSRLFLRGRAVWIRFTDKHGVYHRSPTGQRVDKKVRRRGGDVIWPRHVLRFQEEFDARRELGIQDAVGVSRSPLASELRDAAIDALNSQRRPNTISHYRLSMTQLIKVFGDVPVGRLAVEDMEELREKLLAKYGDQTASSYIRSLRAMFNWGLRRGILDKNPITRDVLVRVRRRHVRVFTDAEMKVVFDLIKKEPDMHNVWRFLFLTGFRVNEAVHLKWSDVDLATGRLVLYSEKEQRPEYFPVGDSLRVLLESLSHTFDPWVFAFRNKSAPSHRMTRMLRDVRKLEKYKGMFEAELTLHTLRKNFITSLIRSGRTPSEVHKLARHTSFSTTMAYYIAYDMEEGRAALDGTFQEKEKQVG